MGPTIAATEYGGDTVGVTSLTQCHHFNSGDAMGTIGVSGLLVLLLSVPMQGHALSVDVLAASL